MKYPKRSRWELRDLWDDVFDRRMKALQRAGRDFTVAIEIGEEAEPYKPRWNEAMRHARRAMRLQRMDEAVNREIVDHNELQAAEEKVAA